MTAPRRDRVRATVQLVLGIVAAIGCAWSWLQVRSTIGVAPVASGEPSTTSVVFSAPMLVLTFLLAAAAGVLLVVGVAGWLRNRAAAGKTLY